ncbi:hypothetical protein [Mastigocladopsis repens]|uniref:hypothetical protein n=1 Tax=Mastigocladopsis repens TaxID=221287 RepID=UPI00031D6686|nr:hypothetical protein [Mastigocladopsis repens]
MLNQSKILGSIAAGLLFAMTSGVAQAQMPAHSPENTSQFRRIEQPLVLKIAVTLGGGALIGLELWWFLLSKTQGGKA